MGNNSVSKIFFIVYHLKEYATFIMLPSLSKLDVKQGKCFECKKLKFLLQV